MSGKTAKAARKAQGEELKKFPLTKEEQSEFKRILSTMGFFNASIEGLQALLQIKQAQIEVRHGITTAPEGYSLKSRIDLETGFLMVKKIKNVAPKADEKK